MSSLCTFWVACGGEATTPPSTFEEQKSGAGTDAPPAASSDSPPPKPAPGGACTEASDCAVVFDGDVCQCTCEYAAIRADQADAWADAQDAERSKCPENISCGPCPKREAICQDGVCAVAPPP